MSGSAQSASGPLHIIVNPIAGHGKAPEFVEKNVVPLLKSLDIPFEIHPTQSERDAGRIGKELLSQAKQSDTTNAFKVVIAGGDGTAHELIEGLLEATHESQAKELGRWELIILPLGTANALHASLFPLDKTPVLPQESLAALGESTPEITHSPASLLQAVSPSSTPFRLPVTLANLQASNTEQTKASTPLAAHIVLSTAFHAAILSDSEALRAEHPGVERFKIAAVNNLPVTCQANATLHGRVLQYSPKTKSFVPPFTADVSKDGVRLDGPFSYFTSSTTADRFEPTFVIAPTLSLIPTTHQAAPSMDIIVVRPLRDPVVQKALKDGEETAAEARGKRLMEVMTLAYQNGHHVDVTYSSDGSVQDSSNGEVVVEVFRCEGFDWVPTDLTHAPSHLVCADGSIHTIPRGGRASVGLMRPPHAAGRDHGFFVWG